MERIIKERTLMKHCSISAAAYVKDGVKKFLLLDLDGVFVPYSYNTPPKAWYGTDKQNNVRYPNKFYTPEVNRMVQRPLREPKSYNIRWSSELIAHLNALAADPTLQIVWVTTWREDMGGVVDFMGIKSARPMVYLPWGMDMRGEHHFHKLPAVDHFLNSETIDDPSDVKVGWADDLALKGLETADSMFRQLPEGNVLLVEPSTRHAMSRANWESISNFLA